MSMILSEICVQFNENPSRAGVNFICRPQLLAFTLFHNWSFQASLLDLDATK